MGGSERQQLSTVATVTPQAADRFYTLLRRLREGGEANYKQPSTCNGERSTHWLGDVNDQDDASEVMDEVECIGVGKATTLGGSAPLAQLDRASVYGTEGREFESLRARRKSPQKSIFWGHAQSYVGVRYVPNMSREIIECAHVA